jgi:hypothetical protein
MSLFKLDLFLRERLFFDDPRPQPIVYDHGETRAEQLARWERMDQAEKARKEALKAGSGKPPQRPSNRSRKVRRTSDF